MCKTNTNKKNIEVELRALVKNDKELVKKIKSKGAKLIKETIIHDIYFCLKNQNTIKEVEMNKVGSYSLRLRKSIEKNKTVISINTKSIIKESDYNAWEEHETIVESFDEMAKILLATEFKPFFELKKKRKEYKLAEINISLEEIEYFGSSIEVEIMTTAGQEKSAKDRLKKLLSDLGISDKDIVSKSITNIIMRQRAFKSKIAID